MREMKDSGISWVGEIPTNWTIGRIGGLYSLRNQKVSDKDYEPLSVTMKGVLPQLETAAKTNDGDNRKLVKKGDFAINSRSDRRGSCGIADRDGSVSLINTILKPRNQMNAKYYNWLFHSPMFADEFYKWGHGIVDDLWSTNWEEMKKIQIPIPALEEQQKIADFLDRECGKIDGLKADIQAQIDTLEQYKRSVITEAVTHGLNPSAPMKDSGISWGVVIPQNWEIKRLKYLFKFCKGLPITKDNLIDQGLPVISYGQIHAKTNNGVDVRPHLLRFVGFSYQTLYPLSQVMRGDFVFADTSEDYDGCGNCVYKRNDSLLFAGYHTIIAHRIIESDNRFFAYLFQTDIWRRQIREKVSGVKVFSITQKTLSNSYIILPPLDEQQEIADYLDNKCAEIERIIADKKSQIETLDGYKKSLIYEYVTGKKEAD